MNRSRVSPTGSVVSKITSEPAWTPGRDRGDRRIHVAVVGLLLVVEHDRHDQDDDVGLARGGRAVGRRPEAAAGVGRRDELGETGLLGDVRAALVDRVDDRSAGRRPRSRASRGRRTGRASGRPILPAPTTATVPAVPGSPIHGRDRRAPARGRRRGRAARSSRRAGSGPTDRAGRRSSCGSEPRGQRRSGRSRGRRRPPSRSEVAIATAHRPSSASTTGRPPVRTTPRNASSSAASGSADATGSSATSPSNVGA